MERSTVIVLGMLFIALGFLLVIDGVEGKTITVDANGGVDFTKIQDAINTSSDGDTIRVWEGTYYENVVVNKTVSLIGNGSEQTTIDGGGEGDAVQITVNWVNMSGFSVTGGGHNGAGIKIESDNNHIIGNNCSNNGLGIQLWNSNNSTITNNTSSNNAHGIQLSHSSFAIITNNTYSSNRIFGIYLASSSFAIITNNTSSNIHYGIYLLESSNSTITNNTCLSNNYMGIYLAFSSNSTITNNTSSNNKNGIQLWDSNNSTITNNICLSNNNNGIQLSHSSFAIITNNTCSSNNLNGIDLHNSSNSIITNNTISNNAYGIDLQNTSNSTITNNTILVNRNGIYLQESSRDNTAHYNYILNNTDYGINTTKNGGFKLEATNNWWGDTSGPYHPEKNSMGKGDNVSNNVIFKPWLIKNRNIKPEITYVNMKNNSVVGSTVEIIVTAIDYDGFIDSVEISINGSSWICMEQFPFNWSYRWDSSDMPDGETEIKIRCYDGEDYSDEITLIIKVENSTDDKDKTDDNDKIVSYILYILLIILITILISVIAKVVDVRIK